MEDAELAIKAFKLIAGVTVIALMFVSPGTFVALVAVSALAMAQLGRALFGIGA